MKINKSLTLSLGIFLCVFLFNACSKDSNNPVTPVTPPNVLNAEANLTLNGAGYTNKSITLGNGLGAYSPGDTVSTVFFSGKDDTDSLFVYIISKGNQTGTINWNQENGVVFYKVTPTGNLQFIGTSQGTTTISTYGAVNSKIEGSVSGKLIEATSQTELNISGNFSAVRIPDIN